MPSVKHEGFRQLRGDDSNKTFGIVVGESSRALHICSADDVGTDWSLSAFTHPTLLIHSATTPESNYLKLYQTGSSGIIDVGGTTVFTLTSSTIATALPITSTYSSGTALAITTTQTAAANVMFINTTATATSGQTNGFVSVITSTGDGKASTVACNLYVAEQGNTDYIYPLYIGTAAISNKTIIQATGIFMYLEDMGNAVEHQAAVSINRNITNVGTASDCFLQMRNHGSTAATTFIRFNGKATYIWDFQDGSTDVPVSAWSSGTIVDFRAAVRMHDGTTRYVHLFTT